MSVSPLLGQLLHSCFLDHLITLKGLRPASVRSYRDTVRLFVVFMTNDEGCKITCLSLTDFTIDRVAGFLRHLAQDLGNHIRTRNQRLAALVNESGRPIAEVARDIGVNEGTLGMWVTRWRSEHVGEEPPLGISERVELAQLRRDNQTAVICRKGPARQRTRPGSYLTRERNGPCPPL